MSYLHLHLNLGREKHTNGIISRAGSQNANLNIVEESGVSAETRDIGDCTRTVGEVVGEAGLCAGREAAEVLCQDGSGYCREEGKDGWELHDYSCLFLFELEFCAGSCLDGLGMRMRRGGSKEWEREEVIYFSTSRYCIVVSVSDGHMARLLLDAYSGKTRHERRGSMPLYHASSDVLRISGHSPDLAGTNCKQLQFRTLQSFVQADTFWWDEPLQGRSTSPILRL